MNDVSYRRLSLNRTRAIQQGFNQSSVHHGLVTNAALAYLLEL